MKTNVRLCILILVLLASSIAGVTPTFAQTPGLIYKPATNGGDKILDPNRDGYVSKTKSGFPGINMDSGSDSEIPYNPFPVLESEPVGDLSTGPTNGHTDFAEPIPLYYFFDGTNFLFRVRLAGQSTASKGYSILIDSDLDINQTGHNPGFEYEIVLATNFDVRVYDHTGSYTSPGPQIFNGSVDQFSQKSFAASLEGGDDDYFYDFYVPISAFNGDITASTPIRMTATTITAGGTGFYGTLSDRGAVDDRDYKSNSPQPFKDAIGAYPPTSPDGTQAAPATLPQAIAPVLDRPIYTTPTQVNITGSSIEVSGSVISVYRNGTLIGTTTVNSNGRWSLTLGATVLNVGDIITALVDATNKTTSPLSDPETVQAVPSTFESCKTTVKPPYIVDALDSGSGLKITTYEAGSLRFFYYNSTTKQYEDQGAVNITNTGEYTGSYIMHPGGNQLAAGIYATTFTPANSTCQSVRSNELCVLTKIGADKADGETVAPPVINPATDLTYNSTQITGTTDPGTILVLYKNTNEIEEITPTPPIAPATKATWAYNIPAGTLLDGDVFWARAKRKSQWCGTDSIKSSISNSIKVVYPVTAAPTITGTYCGNTTFITGTSTEAAGTQIRLYSNGTLINNPVGPHAVVDQYGYWQANGLNISAGSTITARATNTVEYKSISPSSNAVTITAPYNITAAELQINGPVIEGATSLTGIAPANSWVMLYIKGELYTDANNIPYRTQSQPDNTWSFNNISPFELYAGADLTIKASTDTSCPSTVSSAPVTVDCRTPNQAVNATPSQTAYCPGSFVNVTLDSSEPGIIYNLYIRTTSQTDAEAVAFGTSVLGTGKPLRLTSVSTVSSADNGKVIIVRTEKEGADCWFKIGDDIPLTVYSVVPNNYSLSATNQTDSCPGEMSEITVTNVDQNYSYQLYNATTNKNIGSPMIPTATGGSITFPAIPVYVTEDYNVRISRLGEGCAQDNDNTQAITITRTGPTVNQTVTPSSLTICEGSSASFTFRAQAGWTYQLFNKTTNTYEGTPVFSWFNNDITLTTNNLTTSGTYNYFIEARQGWPSYCTTKLITEPSVTVTNNPAVAVSAGPNQKICGPATGVSTTLRGSAPAPGNGQWTKKSGIGGTITSPTDPNTTVTGLTSGTYVFTWTVTTTCGTGTTTTSSDVTITVNCAPLLTVSTNKFYGDYANNELLATLSDDIDGGFIALPTIVSGAIPPATKFVLDADNKLRLRVDNVAALMPGSYTFTTRTTDARGVTSDTPILIRIYSPTEAPTPPTPLPVQLAYFTAIKEDFNVLLQWITVSENDNDYFEVEKSTDKLTYEKIGELDGAGNSSQQIKYNFTDTNPGIGTVYYRLKQVDYSGEYTFSNTIAVTIGNYSEVSQPQAYPNPFRKELNIVISQVLDSEVSIELFDMQGRAIFKNIERLESGINEVTINTEKIDTGIYFLKLTGPEINTTLKLLKAR